jgi:hypothetical protein
MQKIILVVVLVLVLSVVVWGSVIAYENKYLWMPMSEDQLRAKISEFYNTEISQESCELNNSQGFSSKENCIEGVKCISDELSKIIPTNDLRKLANDMQDKAESEVIEYFKTHQEIEQQYRNIGTANCSN